MSGLAVVTAARRYRALFNAPGVARVAWPSLLGRLPYGMSTLLFVLAVHYGTGSYAIAGIATAAHSATTALTAPWLGRVADRGHAVGTLFTTGIGYPMILVFLVLALAQGAPHALIILLSGVAGAVNPPIGAVTRVVIPGLAPDHAQTAFALDAIVVESTFVLGPVIIAAITAAFSPYAAVLLTAALGMVGALGVACAPGLRGRYATPVAAERKGRLLRWSLVLIVLIGGLESAAYGVMEVAIPSFASGHDAAASAGFIVAAWSAGSILGGVWFSGMTPRLSPWRQFSVLMLLNALGFAAMLLATGPLTLALILFLGGTVISPTTTVECELVTSISPADRATEAFTWTGTGVYLGFATGSAISGLLVGAGAGFNLITIIAAGMVLCGALLTLTLRRPADGSGR